jgi:hypothetical protein
VWARLAASAFTNRGRPYSAACAIIPAGLLQGAPEKDALATRQLAFGSLAFLKRLARFARLVRGADGAHT